MIHAPLLQIVPQRYAGDCGVAALASMAHVTYEEALVALSFQEPSVIYAGASATNLVKAGAELGLALKAVKQFDLEADTGILWVSFADRSDDHVVILVEGKIIDGNEYWEADVFLQHKKAKPVLLLVEG